MSEQWWADALCAQVDTEIFFPENHGSVPAAKSICGKCEVRTRCLEYALANDEYGIWGGTTRIERTVILAGRDRSGRQKRSQATRDAIVAMAMEGASTAFIAAELKLHPDSVSRIRSKLNVPAIQRRKTA